MHTFLSSLTNVDLPKIPKGLLFLISTLTLALHSAVVHTKATVQLIPGEDALNFTRHIWQTNKLDERAGIDDAIRLAEMFTPNDEEIINFGLSKSAIWLRFDVRNASESAADWRISFNRVLLDEADIYKVQDGVASLIYTLDNTAEKLESYREYRTLSALLTLTANEHATIYVRYLAPNWSGLPISLQTNNSLKDSARIKLTLYLLSLLTVAVIVLFTLSHAPTDLRTTSYFVASQLVYFLYFSHMSGFTTLYLWPMNPKPGAGLPGILSALHSLFIVLFARRFFETKKEHPKFDIAIRVLLLLLIVYLGLSLLFPTDTGRRTLNPFGQTTTFLTWVVMPCLAIAAVKDGKHVYWPLVIGWLVLAGTLMMVVLMYAGVVNSFYLGIYAYGALACFEALCMSLAQSLRSRSLARKIHTTEHRLSSSLQQQLVAAQTAEEASTERKMALQDLSDLGNALVSSSHDAQQLVFALKNVVRGLQDRTADDDTTKATHIISQITESLGELLVTQTQSSYTGGINNQTMALEMMSASAMLEAQRLIHKTSANNANIQFLTRCQEDNFASDKVMVQRVLSNMVSNALKHSGASKILLTSRKRRDGILFQIWDNGRGMEQARLDSLLHSAKHHSSGNTINTGEGLRNCQRLATRLGGKISARSQSGRGSLFELFIPAPAYMATAAFPAISLISDNSALSDLVSAYAHSRQLPYHRVRGDTTSSTLASSGGIPAGLVIIDQEYTGATLARTTQRLVQHENEYTIVVTTRDRSIETRMNLSLCADIILYQPISPPMLEVLPQWLKDTAAAGAGTNIPGI